MPAWPIGLPQNILLNYQDGVADGMVLRFATEGGKAKIRKRYTTPIREITSASIYVTTDQKVTLDLFYQTYCASTFDWINPDPPNSTVSCRFLSKPVCVRVAPDLFLATFGFEILP